MKKILTLLLSLLMILSLVGCNSKKEEEPTHIHQYEVDEDGMWICTEDSNILSNTDKPYVAVLEDNEPKGIIPLDSITSNKTNLGNGVIYKEDNTIFYNGNNAQTIIIKTEKDNKNNEDKVVINAPNDTVYHYGSSSVISLDAVATNSFHEYGKVDLITLTVARIVLETLSNVKEIYLDINNPNYNYESAIIALKEEAQIPNLSRDTVDLQEGEIKTLAVIQQLKDEIKQDNTVETKTEEESFVKIENIAKSDNDLIIQAFLSPSADTKDNTKLEKTQTSTTTLEEAKEGSNHPASKNVFVSKDEKVIEVVKPQETSRKDETKQETKQETKPVVTPSVTPKQEETKKDDPKPTPTPTPVITKYSVTAQVQGSHGTAAVKKDGVDITKATKGTNLVFEATPNDGYEFDYWEVVSGGIDIEAAKTTNPISLTMPGTALTLKAHFKVIAPSTYNIIVEDDGHGTASANPTSAAPGATINLTATPNDGYAFKEWQIIRGLESITGNSFTMPSNDVKVKAVFEKEYAVEVEAGGHGSVSADVAKGVSGKAVKLTITPDAGYETDQITVVRGGVTVVDNKFNIGIADVKIRVTFKAIIADTYGIIVEDDGHGTAKAQVGGADVTSAAPNATVTLVPTANDGYAFKEWEITRGLDSITSNSFTMPSNEVKVKAIFERVYNITLQTNEYGKASATVGGKTATTAAANTEVTLTAIPDEGYQFKEWKTVSGGVSVTENKFTMPAKNVTIQAVFEAKAPATKTFKAVYNTNGDANTLTFYYDAVDHSEDKVTVYDKLPIAATKASDWGYNGNRSNIKSVVIDNSVADYNSFTSTAYMFQGMTKATGISGAEYLDVSNVTDMSYMFQNFGGGSNGNPTTLNSVPNVSGWNTSKVTNMTGMFESYGNFSSSLDKVPDISDWNTSNVTNMAYMFQKYGHESTSFNVVPDVSNWNTGNVTNMTQMFKEYGYKSTSLGTVPDVSGWNTGKVENMQQMFNGYGNASTNISCVLDLSGWDLSKITSGGDVFNFKPNTFDVTIPAKTGEKPNGSNNWYYGDGTNFIAPPTDKTFTPTSSN